MRTPSFYRITVKGNLGSRWSDWFDGLAIADEPDGNTVLWGSVADQASLHGILGKIRDLGLPLIAVQQVEAHPATDLKDADGAERDEP